MTEPVIPGVSADLIEAFVEAYAECAMRTDGPCDPTRENPDPELADETLESMGDDCREFLAMPGVVDAIRGGMVRNKLVNITWTVGPTHGAFCQAGVDFWLTRNGHPKGFLGGKWPQPAAKLLADAAEACGARELYADGFKVFQREAGKPAAEYIDITPTFEQAIGMLLPLILHGDATGRGHAIAELRRMGRICDASKGLLDVATVWTKYGRDNGGDAAYRMADGRGWVAMGDKAIADMGAACAPVPAPARNRG